MSPRSLPAVGGSRARAAHLGNLLRLISSAQVAMAMCQRLTFPSGHWWQGLKAADGGGRRAWWKGWGGQNRSGVCLTTNGQCGLWHILIHYFCISKLHYLISGGIQIGNINALYSHRALRAYRMLQTLYINTVFKHCISSYCSSYNNPVKQVSIMIAILQIGG